MSMEQPFESLRGKTFKVFFVEEDDDDRERVIEARVDNVTFNTDHEYADIMSDYSDYPVKRYVTSVRYTLEQMTLLPLDDEGHVLRIRDFMKEDDNA
jgi:hypothetical protein